MDHQKHRPPVGSWIFPVVIYDGDGKFVRTIEIDQLIKSFGKDLRKKKGKPKTRNGGKS